MSVEVLRSEIEEQFRLRKFAPALALAILDFLERLNAPGKFSSLEEVLARYPRQQRTRRGGTANTLIVKEGDETISLRPFYNEIERFFRIENKRFDFPNMAPHATQAWGDYRRWFDLILALNAEERAQLRAWTIEFVLSSLPSHEVDPTTILPLARPFSRLLASFPVRAQKGEKAGATFQGMVFAYIRADAPHLFLEVAKVGAGSKRLQRVGDIDGWQGERLVMTVECKSFNVDLEEAEALGAFLGEAEKRKALATVAAVAMEGDAVDFLMSRDARVIDLPKLRALVDLWDPLKQQAAYEAFSYYAHHVQQNDALIKRLKTFTDKLNAEPDAPQA